MELSKKLNVPVEYFYDMIVRSVLADIKQQTNQNVTEAALVDFQYTKTFSKSASATVEITALIKNEYYEYRTNSNKNKFTVAYKMHPIDETTCELHYSEVVETNGGFIQKLNDAFVGVVWSFLKKKKFNEMLKQIEATYRGQQKTHTTA
ncbi:protein of unknown function [Halolactibacillus halophilus]|uniref:Polyketide cyclase / dehydrase and lipid transport n=1 Tax=Halolactibacillus halophilus TaxID=306540 RepID=A0A1I5P399_9BACI|nr:DUF3284 domain-containing protein [Halolactibacillus halophilus]GEM01530.1 hypothetical protein HHA03_10620 [Halolactibacillus halophilus]SFP27976.1 protein of unknown function [Halolactibacillus halophilus]